MSCFFCESFYHLSQNCDIYVSDKSRKQKAESKNCCSDCLAKSDGSDDAICQCSYPHENGILYQKCCKCKYFKKCYICFLRCHHTVFCPKKSTILPITLFLPNKINKNLIQRYINSLSFVERYSLAFSLPEAFYLIKVKPLTIGQYYLSVKNAAANNNQTFSVVFDLSFRFHSILKNTIFCPYRIVIKNTSLSSQEFLQILSTETEEIQCFYANFTSRIEFVEMIQKIPSIKKIDFWKTNILVEKSWVQDLLEWKNGNDLQFFKIAVNEFDFNVEVLAQIIKVQTYNKDTVKTINMSFLRHCYSFICGNSKPFEEPIIEPYIPPKTVYLKDILPQQFSIPKPIMRYLLKHANVKNQRNLQQTCRYFYSKFHYIIIDNLCIYVCRATKISNFSMDIPQEHTELLRQNLYITKQLFICSKYNIKPLLSKIIKSDFYEIGLYCKITISEFQLLTELGNLKILNLECFIYFSEGTTKVPFEDILSYIPNVYHFTSCAFITPETTKNLFALKRNVKLKYLYLNRVIGFFDPYLFNEYIKVMFDFDDNSTTSLRGIKIFDDLHYFQLEQLYELVKSWREKSYLCEFLQCLTIR